MSFDRIVIRKIKKYEFPDICKIFSLSDLRFSDPSQEENLIDFLSKNSSNYYVIELDGNIVGGGGYAVSFTRTAFISWILIYPVFKNQGFGSLVLKQIIKDIQKDKRAIIMEALASQHTYLFFQKFGLVLTDIRPGFWCDGLDMYRMKMKVKRLKVNKYKQTIFKPITSG